MIKVLYTLFGLLLGMGTAMAACPSGATCMATVATNAALKAAAAGFTAYLQRVGYYVAGDGGDALYAWSSSSTCIDDGGSCIVPSSNPSSGRWLLSNDGAVSVKVFGATCDNITDDTAPISAALAATSAVFVPANTSCAIRMCWPSGTCSTSGGDGLLMHDGNHLYGQNAKTSVLNYRFYGTPQYDFISSGKGATVVVNGNVGTVTTGWSHGFSAGQTIRIADTVDASGNLGSHSPYTIVSVTSPTSLTINTTGVGDGTYSANITSLIGTSGNGFAAIHAQNRDTSSSSDYIAFELDHLSFAGGGLSNTPITWIDLTGTRNARVHDLRFAGASTSNGEIGVACNDTSPINNNAKTCFFDHVYDIDGSFQTVLHSSAATNNANDNLFERFAGANRVMIDNWGSQGGTGNVYIGWYFASDADANSYSKYYNAADDSTYIQAINEGSAHYPAFNPDRFASTGATGGLFDEMMGIRTAGPLVMPAAQTTGSYNASTSDATIECDAAGATVSLPSTLFPSLSGGSGGQIIHFLTFGGSSTCVISGNGKTINGSGSNYTLANGKTVTLQYFTGVGDWRVIGN